MDKEKIRVAWETYRCRLAAERTYDAVRHYPEPEKIFAAGYSAANEWVRIDGPEDLPKEEGFYLWQYRSNGGHNVQYIHDTTPEYYVAEYAAWRKVEPYQSKGEVSGED